nr:helix-turn-helix domain-containing protein [Streptomyces akebiae]
MRRCAVAAVESGVPRTEVARLYGVSRQTVGAWVRAYRLEGSDALRPRRRGRRPGDQLALSSARQLWMLRTMTTTTPDKVGLRDVLWTWQSLAALAHREFGVVLGTTTIRNYLTRWGFCPDTAQPTRMLPPSRRPGARVARDDGRRDGRGAEETGDRDAVDRPCPRALVRLRPPGGPRFTHVPALRRPLRGHEPQSRALHAGPGPVRRRGDTGVLRPPAQRALRPGRPRARLGTHPPDGAAGPVARHAHREDARRTVTGDAAALGSAWTAAALLATGHRPPSDVH